MIRIGLGYDLHRLITGRTLLLGGVTIPSPVGEDGHSDGDVLFHAAADALLGASGLGDIGSFFPPEDIQWKNADSSLLLKTIWNEVRAHGWKLENIDCVVAIEKPKILPYRDAIRKSIAAVLECSIDQVFVKAKTGEKVDAVGRGEAATVWAVCLLSK